MHKCSINQNSYKYLNTNKNSKFKRFNIDEKNKLNVNINRVKIIVTVPIEDVGKVRNAICEAGAGIIGNYTHCSMSTKCIGTFKTTEEANPYIGEKNNLEFVEEEKLEVVCDV